MERANLSLSQWLWWTERDSLLLAYYDDSTDKFTSPTATDANAGKKVNILFIQRPTKFLISGEEPSRDGYSGTDEYNGVPLSAGKMTDADMMNQRTEIPEQFHEALVNRVIANGYERKAETLPLSNHYMMKYERGIKSAKAYAIRGRDGSLITQTPIDF